MNYAEMSDFEISVRVGDLKGVRWANLDENYNPLSVWNGDDLCVFDPCNSWADAGPIIQENYLSIECDDMFDVPMSSSYWKAYNPDGADYSDENPLRAAMIVFLMMQESK